MADDLCGPSNALQNFQKHSTVDRTLQQDRIVSRQSPSQGFRSSPGPNAGLLDPEFEAFQAGHFPLESHQPSLQHLAHNPPPHLQQSGAAPSAAWANDFQRLNISSTPPQFQPTQLNQAHQGQDAGAWRQDFGRQFQVERGAMPQPLMQEGYTSQFSSMISGGIGMRAGMQPQFRGGMASSQTHQEPQQSVEVFDDEAFARAFENAAQAEMSKEEQSQPQEQDGSLTLNDVQLAASAEHYMSLPTSEQHSLIPEQERIGADLIHDPSDSPRPEPEDPDAMARTAGQLLDSVRSNTSEKFQNSQFLQLMRQFRDREVQVEGDKIVGRTTGTNTTGSAGEAISGGVPETIQVQP